MRAGQRDELRLDVDPGERLRDHALAGRRRRREGDDLVPERARGLGEAGERAADVVVHAGPLVRERADVEGDPHRAAYSNA